MMVVLPSDSSAAPGPGVGQSLFTGSAGGTDWGASKLPDTAPVVLVWDNHSSHTAGWVSRELADRSWLSVVHLPKYGPELNPVETLWSHLKAHLANRAFRSLEELERVMRSHLRSVQR